MVSRKLAVKLIKLLGTAPHSFEELCPNQTEHVQDNLDRIGENFPYLFQVWGIKGTVIGEWGYQPPLWAQARPHSQGSRSVLLCNNKEYLKSLL